MRRTDETEDDFERECRQFFTDAGVEPRHAQPGRYESIANAAIFVALMVGVVILIAAVIGMVYVILRAIP